MILQATSETGDRPGGEGGHQAQVKKMMMMMLMMMMIMTMMMPQSPPDTVQSLQHEIEVIKAKIAQEREKIRVGECDILLVGGHDHFSSRTKLFSKWRTSRVCRASTSSTSRSGRVSRATTPRWLLLFTVTEIILFPLARWCAWTGAQTSAISCPAPRTGS